VRSPRRRMAALTSVAVGVTLTLTACGDGGSIDDETAANEERAAEFGDCADINMAINP
jgi:glycine betaine/proline transport system substrate-binding protein